MPRPFNGSEKKLSGVLRNGASKNLLWPGGVVPYKFVTQGESAFREYNSRALGK